MRRMTRSLLMLFAVLGMVAAARLGRAAELPKYIDTNCTELRQLLESLPAATFSSDTEVANALESLGTRFEECAARPRVDVGSTGNLYLRSAKAFLDAGRRYRAAGAAQAAGIAFDRAIKNANRSIAAGNDPTIQKNCNEVRTTVSPGGAQDSNAYRPMLICAHANSNDAKLTTPLRDEAEKVTDLASKELAALPH